MTLDNVWTAAIFVAVALTVVRTLKAFSGFFPPWSTWLWFVFGLSPGPFIIGGFFLYRRHTVRALERKLQRMRRVNEQAKAEADEADDRRLRAAMETVKVKTMEGDARLQADLCDTAAVCTASALITDADVVGQLERLASLHAQGHLSEGEFDAAKQRVLCISDSSGSGSAAAAAATPPSLPPPMAAAAAPAAALSAPGLSAPAAALRVLLDDALSAAARARRAAYHAAIKFSPDEDLLLFVQEASAWRRIAQREEAAAAPAEGSAAPPALPRDALEDSMGSVTAGELFEEYLSREARERILADGGGAVELDADARR